MRLNKMAMFVSFGVSIVALGLAITLNEINYDFSAGIFVGIFSSGLLTLLMAILNYLNARKKMLEKFWGEMAKVIRCYNRFENRGKPERTMDIVLQMNEFDYSLLDDAFGDICFLWNNKNTRKYIYDALYRPTVVTRHLITDVAYHFALYKSEEHSNMPVMLEFIEKLDLAIMERKTVLMPPDNGVQVPSTIVSNRLVEKLNDELSGKYYRIMYRFNKTEEGNKNAN